VAVIAPLITNNVSVGIRGGCHIYCFPEPVPLVTWDSEPVELFFIEPFDFDIARDKAEIIILAEVSDKVVETSKRFPPGRMVKRTLIEEAFSFGFGPSFGPLVDSCLVASFAGCFDKELEERFGGAFLALACDERG
jgi:hypothetical protein